MALKFFCDICEQKSTAKRLVKLFSALGGGGAVGQGWPTEVVEGGGGG
jgi:hypothetical protein